MTRGLARAVLLMSSVALIAVLVAAATSRGGDGADLVGATVRNDPVAEREDITPPTTAVPLSAPNAVPDPVSTGLAVPPPVTLRIDSIGVDAEVVPVDVDEDGGLQIPDATHVGWYRSGAAPGGPSGSTVLTAHVDYNGTPGVFIQLSRLEIGQEVVTVDRAGIERRFTVTERYQVDKDDLDVDELFRRDGPSTLTLITCGGAFDERARHYRDNIVVRAVPS